MLACRALLPAPHTHGAHAGTPHTWGTCRHPTHMGHILGHTRGPDCLEAANSTRMGSHPRQVDMCHRAVGNIRHMGPDLEGAAAQSANGISPHIANLECGMTE